MMKNTFERIELTADLAVVGAGPAGFSAAVGAARLGLKVILVNDRSVIGGNHGREVRVSISGAGHRPWIRYADETGVMHEFLQRWGYRKEYSGADVDWLDADIVYNEMLAEEDNITVILNTLIDDVELDARGNIISISGSQGRSEKHYIIKAPYFADCTGDGTLGYLAGAGFTRGREAKSEYNEPGAPEVADMTSMGSTLCFRSTSAGKPVKFLPVKGAVNFHDWKKEEFPYVGKAWSQRADGGFNMLWWAEVGGLIDQISQAPEIERECYNVIMGIWDYIKNSGRFENVEDQHISWLATVPGKRESRRLLGDYVFTENDLWDQTDFDDAVAYSGYMIDVHPAGGYRNPHWSGSVHRFQPGATDLPLRSLYSKDVGNLFMAGRNISTTQQAMGSTRVAGTCATTALAVAHATKVCLESKLMPAQLKSEQIRSIQQSLLKNDCSILNHTTENNLLAGSSVSASGVREFAIPEGNKLISLDNAFGVFIPTGSDKVQSVEFFFEVEEASEVQMAFYTCNRLRNYRLDNQVCKKTIQISESGWQKIDLDIEPGVGRKIICAFLANDNVKLRASSEIMTGVLPVSFVSHGGGEVNIDSKGGCPDYESPYKVCEQTPLFKINPSEELNAAQNVIDGHIRPLSLPHVWVSGRISEQQQWLEITLPEQKEISAIDLVFNSNQDIDHQVQLGVNKQLVRAFKVEAISGDSSTIIAEDDNNYLRFRQFIFEKTPVDKLRLSISGTWGHDFAEVFAVRAY